MQSDGSFWGHRPGGIVGCKKSDNFRSLDTACQFVVSKDVGKVEDNSGTTKLKEVCVDRLMYGSTVVHFGLL